MAGESALARQLKKLAVPQTTLLIQGKIKKSFLFDHRDAAGLDRDTVFAYGANGLEKLCLLNPRFSQFESNLFGIAYKDFERSVQSREANAGLDERISLFLKMLSPYFLLRAAHEALEWLVNRFHVHTFNADDLVASALPHFSTSVFVRVVQLLDLDERSRWFWLKPIQKSGVHLEYSAILNRFLSDEGFRKFVCNLAPNAAAVYKDCLDVAAPVISFSMLTAYNALVNCQSVDDKLILSLFPYVLKGLKSGLSQYVAASYLVISQMVVNVTMTSDVIEEILLRVFDAVKKDLVSQALQLLLLFFQHQPIKSIPKQVHSVIISNEQSVNILCDLTSDYQAHLLARAVIKRSLNEIFTYPIPKNSKQERQVKFLKKFLAGSKLRGKSVTLCFDFTLKKFLECSKQARHFNTQSYEKAAKIVFKALERKYPEFFDKALKDYIEKNRKVNNQVYLLINNSVCNIKHKMAPDTKTPFVIGLNHINPQIRRTSIMQFIETISKEEFSDSEFLANSLHERLLDDCPKVVEAVLEFSEILLRFLDKSRILSSFEEIFKRDVDTKSAWYPIFMKCLQFIVENFNSEENAFNILPFIVKFVYPVTKHTEEGFLLLLESKMPNFLIEELVSLKSEVKDENYVAINCKILSLTKQSIYKMSPAVKRELHLFLSHKIVESQCHSFISFYVVAMEHLIMTDHENSVECTSELLQVLRFYFSCSSKSVLLLDDCLETAVGEYLASFAKKKFPVSLLMHAFKNISVAVTKSLDQTIDNGVWPDTQGEDYQVLSKIYSFCILALNSFKRKLKEYFKNVLLLIFQGFKEIKHAFKFLCTKWVDYEEEVPLVLQLSSLDIALKLAQKAKNPCWAVQDDAIFFCLIKAVSYPNESVCKLAMFLLCSLMSDLEQEDNALYALAKVVESKKYEILVDSSQCFSCIGNYFKVAAELSDICEKEIEQGSFNELEIERAGLNHFLKLINENSVPLSIKHTILLCLQDVNSAFVLSSCVPVLEASLSLFQKIETKQEKVLIDVIALLLKKFSPMSARCLAENSRETKALFSCLMFNHENDADNCVQKLALKVLNKDFFSALPSDEIQLKLFHALLELYMNSSTSLNSQVAKTLRKLCTYAHIFLKNFQEKDLSDVRGSTLREAKKSKMMEKADSTNDFEAGSWKKLTVLLELMQNKSKLLKTKSLIPDLFYILNKSLDLDNQAPVEYIRQLILSVIYNCCQLLGSEKLDERQFQVELIVQCIRSSTNAKTHQQALMLLNLAARMFPDYVLSNVMSIFTFMGSSLVRQDDSYSFQVISQTIETVVPSLLEASNQQAESDSIQVVASVIRVFVDSLVDIPSHRQLPLFTKLLSTLDPSKYLWIPIGQICDQYANAFDSIVPDDSKNWKISPALEFAVNLHKQFSPNIQIDTCIELANFLSTLPDTKQQIEDNPEKFQHMKEPFNVTNCDVKQLQIYKYNVLSYMKIWLSSQEFLSQVSELNAKEQKNLEIKYEQLTEAVLRLLQDRVNHQQAKSGVKNISNQILILYDLVYAINSLLPWSLFIRVIRSLLKNATREIQIKAIEFLNAKLEQQESFDAEHKKSLQKLLRPLLNFISACTSDEVENPGIATTLQATLYSLHLLCKSIGADYPTKFYPVLTVSIQILTNYHQPELIVNALLCLAQLCSCLSVDILPHLNSFMPVIISILQDRKSLNMNECLILGVVAAMHSIIENLGVFLSSYMEDIITGVCMFIVKYSELGKKTVCEKFEMLQNKIANDICLRVLLGAIENCYSKLTSKTSMIAVPLIKILTEKLNSSSYEEILASAIELQKFYLLSLDFRNIYQNVPLQVTDSVEDSVILSFKTFVMKLSVSRFRTLFQKLYQWSTTTIEDQEQKFRVYTFYKLTCEFSKSLKSLFTQMSKYFFRHISSVLDCTNALKSKSLYFEENQTLSYQLLCNCIDTLNFCFMFAEEQFLDKENFETLMQPLVDQIENLGFEDQYPDLIENHLSSCIAHFMAAVSDNVQWKALNYQILLKTRHSSPKVRFGSLQVIQEVVSVMGDNYLVLLPESIPFLAEIMEDESSEVEQECQNVILEMEKILGEPIRKYF